MAEYLARVTWESVLKYREELNKRKNSDKRSFKLPLTNQYGSNQRTLKKLNYGDGLWLFTAPIFGKGRQKRMLPPSILGRIKITHLKDKGENIPELAPGAPDDAQLLCDTKILDVSKYDYWCCGIPGDVLPIHNAFSLLKRLTFNGRVKKVDPCCKKCNSSEVPKQGPFGHLMQHFQSIRSLSNESTDLLFKLHNHVNFKHTLFLSHRHNEAASLVEKVAAQLNNDALCWWDVQELPQSPRFEDELLMNMLYDGIRQAGWFVAFITPNYASTKWTTEEWNNALALSADPGLEKKPKILPVLLGGNLPKGIQTQPPINVGENAKTIAESIKERILSKD